jgi:hypothetical protein
LARYLSFVLVLSCVLSAQSDLATVTGIVTDSAHAAAPGVNITIRNVETNIARTMVTNTEGSFTITNLPPGAYELIAEKQGFHAVHEKGIVLEVGQNLRNDVQLTVGSVTESVNVSADIAPLNTENGSIKGDVIVQAEIQDIPLSGRDFTDLAFLVPGVVPNAQGGAGSNMSINGSRGDTTNYRVDGFDDRNIRGAAAQMRPNLDAMQEFKMEVAGYSAEYGKMAGGVMNMVLRSGTNQFHGALFEYFRNDLFDARAFFDDTKLVLHQNQFGGVIAGPLSLPRLYNGHNRTFFMLSWESFRLSWGESKPGNVPSALERVGNFTKTVDNAGRPITVKNPFSSNAPFPGNVIPASLFSPVGLNVIAQYPQADRANLGNNYLATAHINNNWDSFVGKIDQRFSESDSVAFRFGKRFGRNNAPWAGSNLGIFQNYIRDDRLLGGIDYTHMFSPTLLAEFRFGVTRNASREHIISDGADTAVEIGMQGSTHDPMLRGFPRINVTNYLAVGFAANEPVQYFVTDWQWGGKFTWIKAKHVVKWGFDYARYQINEPYYNNSRGTMTANGVWTGAGTAVNGNSIGDLLLGLLNTASNTTQTARNYMREQGWGFFFNDDFKISRSLTLNLGLRYELESPAYDKYDRMSNFVPELRKIIVASDRNIPTYAAAVVNAKLTDQIGLAKDYGLPRSLVYPYYKAVAPRVGVAWRLRDKTVLRGGYGIFYSGQLLNDVRNGLDNTFPVVERYNYSRIAADPGALTLSNPWNPARGTQTGTATSAGYRVDAPTGYLQSYNLTLERDIGRGTVLEVGFVGSKGTHLGRQYNINQPFRTIENFRISSTFPVPYAPFGTIDYWDFGSNSIYNAGQVTLRRRLFNALTYRLSYSYSKSIDNNSQFTGQSTGGFAQALDSRNLSLERARSDWDRGHVVTASYSWQLPVGRGRRWLTNPTKVVNGLLGGWQLSGTATFYTGAPITVLDSTINAALGESSRPNRIATGKDVTGSGRRGVDYPWFDPAAFVHTAACTQSGSGAARKTSCPTDQYGFVPFAPGNSGRNILDGPGRQAINASLLKNFTLGERKTVQVRWETFNIFNHPNFLLPNRNYNETAAGIIDNVADSGQGGPRVMQFALRYQF